MRTKRTRKTAKAYRPQQEIPQDYTKKAIINSLILIREQLTELKEMKSEYSDKIEKFIYYFDQLFSEVM